MRWFDFDADSGQTTLMRIATALERLADMQADAAARARESAQGMARWQQEVSEHQRRMVEVQEGMARRSQAHNEKCEREMARRRAVATEDVEVIQ